MERKKYTVTRGFEHPGTGHWLESGAVVEMSERQAKIPVLNGHLKPTEAAKTTAAVATKKRRTEQ